MPSSDPLFELLPAATFSFIRLLLPLKDPWFSAFWVFILLGLLLSPFLLDWPGAELFIKLPLIAEPFWKFALNVPFRGALVYAG
jgi:hypothetical protein